MNTKNIIKIVNKRNYRIQEDLKTQGYVIINVTSASHEEWHKKFSPFYPHGNIPVPGLDDRMSASVEGIWQGLKVFERQGVDYGKFETKSLRGIKRGQSKVRGRVLGHQYGENLLGYVEARKKIYLPAYNYVLTKYLQEELDRLQEIIESGKNIAFLDFDTNEDIEDVSKPLSHASLIKKRLYETMEERKRSG